MGQSVQLEFKIKREQLFERSLPSHRWDPEKYGPKVPKQKRWALKTAK